MVSVVLVNPKYAGNIGSVARAMANFGFSDLCYTGKLQKKDAGLMAVHAKAVLKKARRFGSFEALRSDFDFLVATSGIDTSNDDHFRRIPLSPGALASRLKSVKGKIGIIFGPEDKGLSNGQIEACDLLVTIPTSKKYPVMNLSHAVAVCLYELSGLKTPAIRIATAREMRLIHAELDKIYDKTSIRKKAVVGLLMRRVFARSVLSGREAHTLIGLLKGINKGLK